MKKAPQLWQLAELLNYAESGPQAKQAGAWIPARPFGYFSLRIRWRMAVKVFKGECDALQWPGGQ